MRWFISIYCQTSEPIKALGLAQQTIANYERVGSTTIEKTIHKYLVDQLIVFIIYFKYNTKKIPNWK